MKVVRPGRVQKGWAREFSCTGDGNGGGGCGAVLLIEQGDVYLTFENHMGETDEHHTFACISCGVETDIKAPPGDYPDKRTWKAARGSTETPTGGPSAPTTGGRGRG